MSRYAMVGAHSGDLLTYRGAVITHESRAEMEFLFPAMRVVRISDGDIGQPVMRLRDHPEMAAVRFPLRRKDFP